MYLNLLFAACFVAVSYASRTPAEIRQWMSLKALDCTKSHTVSSKELQMMMNLQVPDTKNAMCFIACVLKKVEWLDDKGKFSLESTNKYAEAEYGAEPTRLENSKKLFNQCKTVNDEPVTDGEEGCERARILAKCLIENAPKMGFDLSKL